jgi:hypothetical protein
MAKKVLLHVGPNGDTKIEAQGYEGGTCLEATSVFEALFSDTVKERVSTGECATGTDMGELAT